MNEREKKLLAVLVSVVALGIVLAYVYPDVVKPMIEYDERLNAANSELQSVQMDRAALEDRLQQKYREYVLRNGGINAGDIFQDIQERVDELLRKARLRDVSITRRPISEDRKSKISTLAISVRATGDYDKCIQFFESFYKLPYIARLDSVKFTPTSSRQQAGHNEVKFDADIEALVPPASKLFGVPRGPQPTELVRTTNRSFSELRRWTPFTREVAYVEPTPPPPTPGPTARPDRPQPPAGPDTWSDANVYVARGKQSVARRPGDATGAVVEVMLERTTDFMTSYVAVGEDLDGGELVLVNAWGAVVHKQDGDKDFGYFVYPFGEFLTSRIPLAQARDWPEIQLEMQRYLRKHEMDANPPAGTDPAPADADEYQATADALLRSLAETIGPSELPEKPEPFVGPPLPDPADDDDFAEAAAGGDVRTSGVATDTNGLAAPTPQSGANASKPVVPRPTPRPRVQRDASGGQPRPVVVPPGGVPRAGQAPSRRIDPENPKKTSSPEPKSRRSGAAADAKEKENDHVAPPE